MKATPRTSIISEAKLRTLLPPVLEELGATDRRRLESLLPLITSDNKARLSECLKTAFPGKSEKSALDAFKVFRSAVNKAATTANVPVQFCVDTEKKSPPAARHCWFEAQDTTEQDIANFSDEGTRDVDPNVIPNTALLTDWPKLIAGSTAVRIFVSYAHENSKEAADLLKRIKTVWKARMPEKITTPDPDWIWVDKENLKGGHDWKQEIRTAMQRAHICLAMVSDDFLASDFIQDEEMPHFLNGKKPIIPIRLLAHDTSGPRVKRLRHLHFVQLPTQDKDKPLCYWEVHLNRTRRTEFAVAVLESITSAINEWRGLKSLTIFSFTDHFHDLIEEAADIAHADDDAHYIPSEGRKFNLTELERWDVSKNLPEGKVGTAFDFLLHWLTDPKSAPFFAVLGELGIGKTTTLKHFTQHLIKERKKNPSLPLPVFVDLRLFHSAADHPTVPTLDELLASVIRHHWKGSSPSPLTPQEIIDAVRAGTALIIFDGLDEKLVHFSRGQAGQFIRELWRILPKRSTFTTLAGLGWTRLHPEFTSLGKLHRPRGRMIFSCRSHYFKDVVSQNALLLGEYRDGPHTSATEVCVILPFNDTQVREYLRTVLGNDQRADDAIAFFKKVHNLSELSRRPFLLSQIVPQLSTLEARALRGERILGISIYDDLAARWLARDLGKTQFSDSHKLIMMEQIAADMARAGARSWPWSEVEKWLGKFLASHPEITVFYTQKNPEVLLQDFRTATFVLRPDDSKSEFRFAHSSLQEYFHARHLVAALDDDRLDEWKIPLPSIETLDFAGQLIAQDSRSRTATLEKLLIRGEPLGATMALRLWLLAVEHGYPEPQPNGVDLSDTDLTNWEIRGPAPDRLLPLRGGRFQRTRLDHTRLENVDFSGADFSTAFLRWSRFQTCRLSEVTAGDANFTGALLYRCIADGLQAPYARWEGAEFIACPLQGSYLPPDIADHAVIARCSLETVPVSLPKFPSSPDNILPNYLVTAIRDAHHGPVYCSAWSPDGRRVLSGSADKTLRVWDATTGQSLLTLSGHSRYVHACAWSPDGRRVLSGSLDNTLRVWDAATGQSLHTLTGHSHSVMACAWSPNGQHVLSGSLDTTLRVWDAATGRPLLTLSDHSLPVYTCAWSPDGRHVLSGSYDRTLRVWDAVTGQSRLILSHADSVRACAWSPDGRHVLSGSADNSLRVWDAATGQSILSLSGHSNSVRACAWSPDGRHVLSGSADRTLRVWDASTGQSLLTLTGHSNSAGACAWSPDGCYILSGSDDQTLRMWDAKTGQSLLTLTGQSRSRSVMACAWSPDGRQVLSGSADNSLRVWDAATGQSVLTLSGHSNSVMACAWSPDGRQVLSGSADNSLRVWDAATGQSVLTLSGHSNSVMACAWSPDGRHVLSGSTDNSLRGWDAATGRSVLTLSGHSNSVMACAWSPNGRRVLSGSDDHTLHVWDAASGQSLLTLSGHSDYVRACAWSPDGRRVLSGSDDRTLHVWDAASGQSLLTLSDHLSYVMACAWSPDGRQVLSGSADNSLRVWDAATGQSVLTLSGHSNSVSACKWSPDGQRVLSGSADNTLRIWDAQTGECLLTMAHLPNGETASFDRTGFRHASPGAWPYLAYRWTRENDFPRLLPAEFFGPLPP